MTRFVPLAVLLVVLAASGVAHAQSNTNMLPGGGQIVFEHRKIVSGKQFTEPTSNTTELLHYFNLAHCNCAKAIADMPTVPANPVVGQFVYHLRETMISGVHFGADFWAGTSCDDATHRNTGNLTCTQLPVTVGNIDQDLFPGGTDLTFNLYQVVNGPQTGDCVQLDNANNAIFALVDTAAGSTNYNYSANQPVGGLMGETATAGGTDTKPPPLPTALAARSNENEIDLSWKPSSGNNTDIAYYQALCAKVDGSQARSQSDSPQYVTTQATCPGAMMDVPTAEVPTPTVLNNGEAAVDKPVGAAFATLDPKFICGQASGSTATSMPIRGLQSDTPYQVILVTVDLHGNFSATYFDHTITPHPVTDFWEDLHDNGSNAEGGLCLLAETYGNDSPLTGALRAFRDDTLGTSPIGRWLGRAYYATLGRLGGLVHGSLALRAVAGIALAPLVALALLWHWLGLPIVLGLLTAAWWLRRFRRRRFAARWDAIARSRWPVRRWLGVAVTGAILVLGAGRAHAGNGGYQPYWEDNDPTRQSEQEQVPPGDPSLVEWHAGVRIGPYTPDIDNQLNKHPGPFESMFGTTQHLMTMLDVDRILWTGFGQVGVGGSIGYWQKTASAFTTMNGQTTTMRSDAHNAMRLIPLALTATYRFTWLDDNYGIPVVPYVRGGLAYDIWWIAINGRYARVCNDGSVLLPCPTNTENKALGASLGLQGSIGLAIRAERVDASTAMSMRQSGIQHAGIYAELSLAKVDGFGSDKKLSVGDRTWFAGVNFEF